MTCHVRQFYLLIFPLLMSPLINHIPWHHQQLSKTISVTWMCRKLQQGWAALPKPAMAEVQPDSSEGKIQRPLQLPVSTATGSTQSSEGRRGECQRCCRAGAGLALTLGRGPSCPASSPSSIPAQLLHPLPLPSPPAAPSLLAGSQECVMVPGSNFIFKMLLSKI